MSTHLAPRRASAHRLHFGQLLHAEWIKLTSLRSSVLALGLIVALGLGLNLAFAATLEGAGLPEQFSLDLVLQGLTLSLTDFAALVAGILGVLVIGSEYSSGTIATTLASSPRRLQVLGAKALVLFVTVTGLALLTVVGSWATTYPLYHEFGLQAQWSTPGLALALTGAAAYVGFCAIVGLGVGTLLRSTAAGIIAVFVITTIAPLFASLLPSSQLFLSLRTYLLMSAGRGMTAVPEEGAAFVDIATESLSPLAGWLTAFLWAAVALTAGALVFRRKDA